MTIEDETIKKGSMVEFRPIVIAEVYHKRKGVLYLRFKGGSGYVSPPYKVKVLK